MIDSGLVFFNNTTITGNVVSPVINVQNYAKFQNANPLSLRLQYNAGNFTSRIYQLIVEQSALVSFSSIGLSLTVFIGSGVSWFGQNHVGRDLLMAKIPIHFQYIRARFSVSGMMPYSLSVARCYLTV